jgi:hypothetical protein
VSVLTCQQCGASVRGYICEYCGALAQLGLDRAAEKEALNELHNIIVAQTDIETKAKLLRHSFLPDAPDVLIEAGMRSIPLIDAYDTADEVVGAAVQRLRAIMAKLRLLGENGQTTAALHEFEQVLAAYQEADQKLNRTLVVIGVSLLILVVVGCLGLVWLLV